MTLSGKEIDPILLGFWESARTSPPHIAFLHSFQILEYAAFYFLSDELAHDLRRILLAPDALSRVEETSRGILDLMTRQASGEDAQRMERLVRHCVTPSSVWPLISENLEFFSKSQQFDGGFSLDPLVPGSCDEATWDNMCHPKLITALRRLRNALAHAREARQSSTILPTRANLSRLRPWQWLVDTVATNVIVYRDV